MVDTYSDAEQVELIKRWFREYGLAALVGIIVALVIGYGWRFWLQHREVQLTHASMRYEQLLTNVVNGNTSAVQTQAERLIKRYPHTPYAQLAALQLARQDIAQENYDDAAIKLRWIMRHGDTPALREVARIRLARVNLAQGHGQEALNLLNNSDDSAYAPASWEAKGDILLAEGKTREARQAYQMASQSFPAFDAMQPILQMKIANLTSASDDLNVQINSSQVSK